MLPLGVDSLDGSPYPAMRFRAEIVSAQHIGDRREAIFDGQDCAEDQSLRVEIDWQ
jgi:hypothetical protein